MFTGIIEQTGRIVGTQATPDGKRLCVEAGDLAAFCKNGASVCVSGVCLTVARSRGGRNEPHASATLEFDVVGETLSRTTLGNKLIGDPVNLERSLSAGDRLDGHFVQGHVDGTAVVEEVRTSPGDVRIRLRPSPEVRPFLIPQGSVAVDGVSLTIAQCTQDCFSIALIPTTLERTTLSGLNAGALVNIESDLLVRTVVHRLGQISSNSSLTMDTLREAGFV